LVYRGGGRGGGKGKVGGTSEAHRRLLLDQERGTFDARVGVVDLVRGRGGVRVRIKVRVSVMVGVRARVRVGVGVRGRVGVGVGVGFGLGGGVVGPRRSPWCTGGSGHRH